MLNSPNPPSEVVTVWGSNPVPASATFRQAQLAGRQHESDNAGHDTFVELKTQQLAAVYSRLRSVRVGWPSALTSQPTDAACRSRCSALLSACSAWARAFSPSSKRPAAACASASLAKIRPASRSAAMDSSNRSPTASSHPLPHILDREIAAVLRSRLRRASAPGGFSHSRVGDSDDRIHAAALTAAPGVLFQRHPGGHQRGFDCGGQRVERWAGRVDRHADLNDASYRDGSASSMCGAFAAGGRGTA